MNIAEDLIATLSNELDNGDYEFGSDRVSVRHAIAGQSPQGEPQLDIRMSDGALIQLRARPGLDPYSQDPDVDNPIEREAVARVLEDLAHKVRQGELNAFDCSWRVTTGTVDLECTIVPKLPLESVTIRFDIGGPDGESEDDNDPA